MNRSMMTACVIPLLLAVGLMSSGCRHDQGASLPDRTLVVHVQNRTSETIPKVEIGYANVDTQQTTTLLQLGPGKTRTIVLNHEPGLGYNVEAHLADGNVLEICGGRHRESRVMREVITQESILSGIGRP